MKRLLAVAAVVIAFAAVPLAAAAPTLISGKQINRLWRLGTPSTGLNLIGGAGQHTLPAFKVYHPSGGLSYELRVNGRMSLTGGLLINLGGLGGSGVTIDPGVALEVIGTMSGQALTVSGLVNCAALQTSAGGVFSCATGTTGSAVAGTGATSQLAYFTAAHALSGARLFYVGSNVGVNGANAKARLTVVGSGAFTGTLSGSALRIQGGDSYILGNIAIGSTKTATTKLEVIGTMSGTALTVSSLSSCQVLQTQSNGAFSCAGGFLATSTGALRSSFQTGFDSRYVNTSGDTMTGNLLIAKQSSLTVAKSALHVIGSGAFTATLSGSALNIQGGNSYILGNTVIGGTKAPATKLEVIGTMSGYSLKVMSGATSSFLGSVGIGKANPLVKLDVQGGTRISGGTNGETALTIINFGAASNAFQVYNAAQTANVNVDASANLNIQGAVSQVQIQPGKTRYINAACNYGSNCYEWDMSTASTTSFYITNTFGNAAGTSGANPTQLIVDGGAVVINPKAAQVGLRIRQGQNSVQPLLQLQNSGATVLSTMSESGWLAINKTVRAKTQLEIVGTMSGTNITLSGPAAPVGSVPCFKAGNVLGWRPVSATGTLNGGTSLCN